MMQTQRLLWDCKGRNQPFAQGFERTESPSWIQKAKPFAGSKGRALCETKGRTINYIKKGIWKIDYFLNSLFKIKLE